MLEDYKKLYERNAQLLKINPPYIEWRNCSKKLLCENCVKAYAKNNDIIAERYLSAIIYRYWNLLNNLQARSPLISTPDLVYSWYIDGILYAIKNHPWTDPESTIYGDPYGYDKCINKCVESKRLTYYQGINRQKRVANFNNASLDDYIKNGVEIFCTDDSDSLTSEINVKSLIVKYFNKKQYFKSLLIDIIINNPCLDKNKKLNNTKLFKYIRELNFNSAKRISYDYGLKEKDVTKAIEEIQALSNLMIHNRIKWSLNDLRISLVKDGTIAC